MVKKPNIIDLNGKRYDAHTGHLLYGSGTSQTSVDGAKKPAAHQATATQHKPLTHAAKPVMDVSRPVPHHFKHHTPHKSQTLMRTTVNKPEPSLKRKVKTTADVQTLTKQPKFQIVTKLSHPKVDAQRLRHAKQISQSEYIHRFAAPDIMRPAHTTARRPAAAHIHPGAIHAVQVPVEPSSSMDIFERALQRANSHAEKPVQPGKKAKRRKASYGKRALSISTGALAVLVLAGFIALQNQANLTMRYASTRAGFSAALPGYQPAGYKAGKFTYSPGLVGVSYSNPSSGQSFSLVQKESTWDSTALLDSYVAAQGNKYKTIESAGRTIYTYGQNNATWVNGGVWYKVTSNGSLTTNDLVNLATSM